MTKHPMMHAKIRSMHNVHNVTNQRYLISNICCFYGKQNWLTCRQLAQLSAEDLRDIGLEAKHNDKKS